MDRITNCCILKFGIRLSLLYIFHPSFSLAHYISLIVVVFSLSASLSLILKIFSHRKHNSNFICGVVNEALKLIPYRLSTAWISICWAHEFRILNHQFCAAACFIEGDTFIFGVFSRLKVWSCALISKVPDRFISSKKMETFLRYDSLSHVSFCFCYGLFLCLQSKIYERKKNV